MQLRRYFEKVIVLAITFAAVSQIAAQTPLQPRQERLLNGLRVQLWPDRTSAKVTVKVRIHSGAAFDPQGKEGVMALLSGTFFPNENSREFFKEDLGGDLAVATNYDYIQLEASSRPDEFLTMLEAVATAVSIPTIDKETTTKLKKSHSELLSARENESSYVADRAVAARLLGTFPYGRPVLGDSASLQKIEFADLIDARQRFLTADNATVSISGNFDPALAFRAVRRYFGSWLKSDKLVPSTFKQPEAPDTTLASFTSEAAATPQTRIALRGIARDDRLYPASLVLTAILHDRLTQNLSSRSGFVRSEAHVLPGVVIFGFEGPVSESTPVNFPKLLLAKPITADEFNAAKSKIGSMKPAQDELWLDADTYKFSASAAIRAIDSVSLDDVQLLAVSYSKNPIVAVTVSRGDKPASVN